MTAPGGARAERDWATDIGLAAIAAGAIVMSFYALADLARMCGRTETIVIGPAATPFAVLHVAWLLPIVLDVLGAVATRACLRGRAAPEAIDYASRAAWAAVLASVGGGMYHGYLIQALARPPWLVAALVSGVPAVVIGVAVHLAMLLRRPAGEPGADRAVRPSWAPRLRAWIVDMRERWTAPTESVGRGQAGAGGSGREAGEPPVPTSADSNDVLAADLRRLNAARRAEGDPPLGRDGVVSRYRIGSPRATTVKQMAEQAETPSGRPHLVPTPEERAV